MSIPCGGCAASQANPANPARREFVARAALAALGTFVLNACGDGVIGGPLGLSANPLPVPLVITVGDFPALAAVGGTARVDAGSVWPIAVTRTGAASFVALSMICPHQSFRPIDITTTGFRCPNHGARFGETGVHVGGQPTSDLRSYVTAYEVATDTLTIS